MTISPSSVAFSPVARFGTSRKKEPAGKLVRVEQNQLAESSSEAQKNKGESRVQKRNKNLVRLSLATASLVTLNPIPILLPVAYKGAKMIFSGARQLMGKVNEKPLPKSMQLPPPSDSAEKNNRFNRRA